MRAHVEHEDLAAVQARRPEMLPIIRETAVVRLVPAPDRITVNHLAVGGGLRVHIHRHKFV
jgi:hypothetical protein